MPDGNPGSQAIDGSLISAMLSLLSGAGFDKVSSGINKLAQSGSNIEHLMSLPNFPLLLAGAGIRDVSNSMELVGPILKMLSPSSPSEEQQQDPAKIQAALSMLSARLGPGDSGLRPPPGGGMGMPPGIGGPPPGIGGPPPGIRPPGLPAAGPPMLGI